MRPAATVAAANSAGSIDTADLPLACGRVATAAGALAE